MSVHFPRSEYGSARADDYITVFSTSIKDSLGDFYHQPVHYAVVDGDDKYMIEPLPDGYYLAGFNSYDSLVTSRHGNSRGAWFNVGGKLITEIKGKNSRCAFRYNNKTKLTN